MDYRASNGITDWSNCGPGRPRLRLEPQPARISVRPLFEDIQLFLSLSIFLHQPEDLTPRLVMALARIRTEIQSAKVRTQDSSSPAFMPEGSLSSIVTYENLVAVFSCPEFSVPGHKRESTARFIVQEPAQKLFAILIETKSEKYLTLLLENDYSDKHLPIDRSSLEILLEDTADLFSRIQHEYLVYSFRRGQFHRKLRDSQVLPFLHQERIGGGGFSSVYRAQVHPLHQDFQASAGGKVSESIIWVNGCALNASLGYTGSTEAAKYISKEWQSRGRTALPSW